VSTVNKDFKVKNGLIVGLGATFGGAVTVGTPTIATHAATKAYVDSVTGSMAVSSTPPASPTSGQLYYDTVYNRVHVYYNGQWAALANMADAELLQEHIHDTSIDGNGMLASIFIEGGSYDTVGALIETGAYNTTVFTETWDGGSSIDNFN
jgi:hypothetical protein